MRKLTFWTRMGRRPAGSRGRARHTGWGCGTGAFTAGSQPLKPLLTGRTSSCSGAVGKDTWPNKLDVTVGGHLGVGESVLDGIREVEEELGLTVVADELVSLGTRKVEK